jgi:hypothetical protein
MEKKGAFMKLQMYADYLEERWGYKVFEREYGFFSYATMESKQEKVIFVQDYYLVKGERGFTKNNVKLFNDIKDLARKEQASSIIGNVYLDSKNGKKILRLFVLLGFEIVSGNGKEMVVEYKMENSEWVRKQEQ